MTFEWAQAALYQPPVVLGKQLHPLSAFHALMLDAVESPLIKGGGYDMGDIIFGVHVCSLCWADRHEVFAAPKASRQWGKSQRKSKMQREADRFIEYLEESWKTPLTWKTGKGHAAKANGAYHLAVFAMRRLGMTEAEAWDCPVARLICYRETYAEQETGESDLASQDEIQGLELLRVNNGR